MTTKEVKVFGEHEQKVIDQLNRCMAAEEGAEGVLCADAHYGYSMPVGGVVAYREHVSPEGVGFDIGCLAAGTPVLTRDGSWLPIEAIDGDELLPCWDGQTVRLVDSNEGRVARGTRETFEVSLTNGRRLRLTADHRIMTSTGWKETNDLFPGALVACLPYRGLPYTDPVGEVSPALRSSRSGEPFEDRLAARGLWPLRFNDGRLPALLRLLAYASGDGHLSGSQKRVSFYTTFQEDADSISDDLKTCGFTPCVYTRKRKPGYKDEIHVCCNSVELHAFFESLGSPVGAKAWPKNPMPWLFDLPSWLRAQFLSAFASAEAITPWLIEGRMPNVAIKQAGQNSHPARFIARLLESFGFKTSVKRSGPPRGRRQTWVVQVLGGEVEQLRFFEQIGFNCCGEKRRCAAQIASVAWQRQARVTERGKARTVARELVSTGVSARDVISDVSARFDVSENFTFHSVYSDRTSGRVGKGERFPVRAEGEIAWAAVSSVEPVGMEEVFDIVTSDPAEAFFADGVVVHNCGNKAVLTDLTYDQITKDVPALMDEIFAKISFGIGLQAGTETPNHPILEEIHDSPLGFQRALLDLAAKQLGTVGGGNHYVDLFADEEDRVWVGVHFGSRGFGHKTASHYFGDGPMDKPPALLALNSDRGQEYMQAMEIAGHYAYAGREVVVDQVLDILGTTALDSVHNHHNYAWAEEHDGEQFWVVRKGATPAFPGQRGFVGGSMEDDAVILEGVDSEESASAFYSTIHGAGRAMSRTAAAGKSRKRWTCNNRDCDWVQQPKSHVEQPKGTRPDQWPCPKCGHAGMRKTWVREVEGAVDWPAVTARLRENGIELRGANAEEAPEAYKHLPEVLSYHAGTVKILHTLRPLGVAMAPGDVRDPYKD